jgi:hypothetical protein
MQSRYAESEGVNIREIDRFGGAQSMGGKPTPSRSPQDAAGRARPPVYIIQAFFQRTGVIFTSIRLKLPQVNEPLSGIHQILRLFRVL